MGLKNVEISVARLRHYLRIYRLASSPDGSLLVASDNLCRLVVFNLTECLAATPSTRQFSHIVKLKYPVYSMQSSSRYLLCGDSHGQVLAFEWNDIAKTNETVAPIFRIGVFDGVRQTVPGAHEINGLRYSSENDWLIVGGAGDNNIRVYDMNVPINPVSVHSGHVSYVNEVALCSPHSFLSASNDGTVRVWDLKTTTQKHTIKVAEEPKVSRPSLGCSLSALSCDGSFMVCGGGVGLGIWHLGSYALATPLESTVGDTHNLTVEMKDDRILSGSTCNRLEQWEYSAKSIQSVETKAQSIYSILHTDKAYFTAGEGCYIDVFLNLGYVSFSLDAMPLY